MSGQLHSDTGFGRHNCASFKERLRGGGTRRLGKIGAIAVGIGSILFVGAGWYRQAASKELRAERFVLTDPDGRVRGDFGLVEAGVAFRILDAKGRVRVNILSYDLGPTDGSPAILLLDGDNNARLSLHVNFKGESWISFGDKDKKITYQIPPDPPAD